MFRRRRARQPSDPSYDEAVTAVLLPDDEVDEVRRATERERAWRRLNAIVAEAVIRQDAAEELLAEIRDRGPLSELAPRGGELASRFLALRRDLPRSDDPLIRRHTAVLREVFDHHAMLLSCSLDLLAVDWRSDRMVEQLERIDGLGDPAGRLEAVRAELTGAAGAVSSPAG
jgi:hypothetical protein